MMEQPDQPRESRVTCPIARVPQCWARDTKASEAPHASGSDPVVAEHRYGRDAEKALSPARLELCRHGGWKLQAFHAIVPSIRGLVSPLHPLSITPYELNSRFGQDPGICG